MAKEMRNSTLVRGEHFPKLASHVLIHYGKAYCDPKDIKNGDIIYCDTPDFGQFKDTLRGLKDLTIITHNGDGAVTDTPATRKDGVDTNDFEGCFKVWYAQNCYSTKEHIIPIPIGFENMKWDGRGLKEQTYNTFNVDVNPNKIAYLNCGNIHTNTAERQPCYNKCNAIDFIVVDSPKYKFPDYLARMSEFKFIISPPGNGVDCHRTWEALFLNRIPVIKSGPLNRLYADFPVLFVDDWSDLVSMDLENEYLKLKSKTDRSVITQEYWNDIIKGATK